jgi:serine/threonine-protein kinase
MAPEMAVGGVIDARTDVFLLGSTLYFVLTGRMRHEGTSLMEIMLHAASAAPVEHDPDLPDELVALVNHATARNPEDRPRTADEFREGLAAWRRHRVSHQLRKEATMRLAQLQGLRAARVVSAPELMRLATECRFGFAQALREWPDNREAKIGLRACLQEMVLWAVMHGDATTGRSLLEELDPPDPEMIARVESLEKKLQKQKLQANKARELEKDRDLTVAGGKRLQLLLRFVIVLLVVRLALLVLRGPESASAPKTLLGVGAFAFVFMALGTFFGRRALLSNQVNRQIIGTVLMMLAGIFANRAHGYLAGLSGAVIMVGDSLVAALSSAMGGLSIRKQVAWGALINLAGAVVSIAWPAYAAYSFSISSLGGLLVVAYVLDAYPEGSR